jgi:hypothetical protein
MILVYINKKIDKLNKELQEWKDKQRGILVDIEKYLKMLKDPKSKLYCMIVIL